jgi:hypothetical protein
MSNHDPFKELLRLKRPCSNCPFRVSGAIELMPGRLEGIVRDLLADDYLTFHCHKTLDGDERDDEDGYSPTGNEAMCAGAAAVMMKRGRPSVAMRIAFAIGAVEPTRWDACATDVIDFVESEERR